jgi:hypothetical protein
MIKELVDLAELEDGDYEVTVPKTPWWKFFNVPTERAGWLSVTRGKNNNISIMWTTHKDHHWPMSTFGPALSITFTPDGTLVNYMESALSMWIKWGYGRGTEKEYNKAIEFINWIHQKLIKK